MSEHSLKALIEERNRFQRDMFYYDGEVEFHEAEVDRNKKARERTEQQLSDINHSIFLLENA
jgi:hypothetical protein